MKFLIFFLFIFNLKALELRPATMPLSGSVEASLTLSTSGNLVGQNVVAWDRIGVGLINPVMGFVINGEYDSNNIYSNNIPSVVINNTQVNYTKGNVLGAIGFTKNPTFTTASRGGIFALYSATGSQANNIGTTLTFHTASEGAGGTSEKLRIEDGGKVGIGTIAPGYALEVGNGAVAGNGAYVNTSDQRLKENSESFTSACSTVDSLLPKLYDWKSTVPSSYSTWANGYNFYDSNGDLQDGRNLIDKQPHGQKDSGFYAQEVETVYPQAVRVSPQGRYNLVYEKFIPLIVACIQEMRQ